MKKARSLLDWTNNSGKLYWVNLPYTHEVCRHPDCEVIYSKEFWGEVCPLCKLGNNPTAITASEARALKNFYR